MQFSALKDLKLLRFSSFNTFSRANQFSRVCCRQNSQFVTSRLVQHKRPVHFYSRFTTHSKRLLFGQSRPWRLDDFLALSSWFVVGNSIYILLGTTSFASMLIFIGNQLQCDEWLADQLGNYLTLATGMKIIVESAETKDGLIRLNGVSVLSNSETCQSTDDNFTWWDVKIQNVDLKLSLWRWIEGKGLVQECFLKSVRGDVDRRHVTWPIDWVPQKRIYTSGDFEFSKFIIDDLLLTIRNPAMKPYSISVFHGEAPLLRKQWLLYDLMCAQSIVGMFDNCLFSVHKPHDDYEQQQNIKTSHLKISGVNIRHLNSQAQGPFAWITSGTLDLDLDLLIPQADTETTLQLLAEEFLDERLQTSPSKSLIIKWQVTLKNLKASVPIATSEISLVSNALIRPIVAYMNNHKTMIPLEFTTSMDLSSFDGSWTIYESRLVDTLAEQVGKCLARLVEKNRQLVKIGLWGVQSFGMNLAVMLDSVQPTTLPDPSRL